MKVLNASVNWYLDCGNDPRLEIVVDEIPEAAEMLFEQKDDLYFAEKDGYVKFFAYSKPGNGYGGHVYNITMKDGSERALVGPWSSRAGCMNAAGFTPSVDVVATDHRGYRLAIAITLELANEAAKMAGVHMVRTFTDYGDEVYRIAEPKPR